MIKAIIFDMNGVIVNDENIHEMAFVKTVEKYDVKLSHQDYLECCAGKTDRRGYKEIEEKFGVAFDVDALLKEKWEMYPKLFPKYKKSFDGVLELIKKLSKIYTLALTSSSSRSEIDLITKEFGVDKYFELIISASDVKNGKPDPEPYLKTAELLNVDSKECVVIEDSSAGVKSAKSAGCFCVAITTTHTKKDLQEADFIINYFSEINQGFIEKMGE